MLDLLIGILIGLIILVVLVVVHELGHAIVASRNGIIVDEFGIGLPPKAWSKKLKNGTIFSINWLLIGGFVKLKGEYDESRGEGEYGSASFWQKTKVLFAGVFFNILFACLIVSALALMGLPKLVDDQFYVKQDAVIEYGLVELTSIEDGSAADVAGLTHGDRIISFAGQKIDTDKQLISLIEKNPNQIIEIVYQRENQELITKAKIAVENNIGRLGIGMAQQQSIRSTWSAPIVGIVTTAQFTRDTVKGITNLFTSLFKNLALRLSSDNVAKQQASVELGEIGSQVTGPIGIVGVIFPAARQAGFGQVMLLAAIISISLAVMNILPIPALDGGRWLTLVTFRLIKKKLTIALENRIQTIGFLVIIAIALLVTILDVKKIL